MVLFNVLHSVFLKVVSSLSSQHTINFPFFLILHEGKKGRHKTKHVALKNILYSAIMTLWVQLTFGNLFIFIDGIYQIYNQYSYDSYRYISFVQFSRIYTSFAWDNYRLAGKAPYYIQDTMVIDSLYKIYFKVLPIVLDSRSRDMHIA